MKNTVILFCSHFVSKKIKRNFDALKRSCGRDFDVVWVYDSDKSIMPAGYPGFNSNYDTIAKLGYTLALKDEFWCNPEYSVLDYFLKHPGYEYYWRVEYDVGFAGSWNSFFRHFLKNDADFLATKVMRYSQKPGWFWWRTFAGMNIDPKDQRSAFFPIERFSRRALRLLDEKYKSGVYGFCEVIVSTLLYTQGLKIKDLGKEFYDQATFRYKGRVELKPGKLCHPLGSVAGKSKKPKVKKFNLFRLRLVNSPRYLNAPD